MPGLTRTFLTRPIQENLVDALRLPVQSRSRSATLFVGVVVGLFVAGLAIPYAFGERLSSSASGVPPQGTDPLAGVVIPGQATAAPGGTPESGTSGRPAGPAASASPAGPGSPLLGGGATGGGSSGKASSGGGASVETNAGGSNGSTKGATSGGSGASPLTSTDRGVTATTVKVGFTAIDTASTDRLGIGIGITVDQQRAAWQAFSDDINARGGLNGRKIVPVVVKYDPASENSQRDACLQLTQNEKVFAVVGGFNFPAAVSCVTRENSTPLFSGYPSTSDEIFATSEGRFTTLFPRASRMMEMTVAALDQVGKVKGRTIGIFNTMSNDPGGRTSASLQRVLEARGYKVKRRADLSADPGTSASQVPVTVNQFQADGINTVFMLAGVLSATQFVNQADGQGYHPTYHLTDWANDNSDFTVQNMPRSFDGTLGTTSTRGNANKVPYDKSPQPEAQRCRKAYETQSGRTLAPPGTAEYGLTTQNCDSIRVLELAATAAGSNLTRASVSRAVPGLGAVPVSNYGAGAYRNGRSDFAEEVRFQVFRSSCSCWQPTGAFFVPR